MPSTISGSLGAAVALCALLSPIAASADANFTPNLLLKSSATSPIFLTKDVEPSIRVDSTGRIFVSAIHGVPGGTDLFQVATSGLTYTYRGQPDGLPVFTPTTGLAPGGGDTDLAIGSFDPTAPGAPGPLLVTSLNLGTVYSSQTSDAGATYTPGGNAAGAFVGDDRQWNAAFGGLERYNVVHDIATGNIQFARSMDGGTTWVNGTPTDSGILSTAANNNELGPIVVDQNHAGGQILYEVFVSGASASDNVGGLPYHTVWVAESIDDGLTWTDHLVYNGPTTASYNHLFPSMAVDALGNLYAVWSDDKDVYYSYSRNHALTWSAPIKVTNSALDGGYHTHIFPWIAAGFNGGIDIVYYQTKSTDRNLASDQWMVGMAQNIGVFTNPTHFYYYVPSDHVVHTGQVCENGIGCDTTQTGNRDLADDFQIAIDPTGHANIAFTDDHNRAIQPQTYFTKQKYGYNIGTPNGAGPNQGCIAYGKTIPGSSPNVTLAAPVVTTLKAPQPHSVGWFTALVNKKVAVSGQLTGFVASGPSAAVFNGINRVGNVPFTGSIRNGVLTVTMGTTRVNATLASGKYFL